MDKSTDQMTFMDEERVILVDREDNIIGSATKRVRLVCVKLFELCNFQPF